MLLYYLCLDVRWFGVGSTLTIGVGVILCVKDDVGVISRAGDEVEPVPTMEEKSMGAFNNYVDRKLNFFDYPPTLCRQIK